jgi:hypothetical protein
VISLIGTEEACPRDIKLSTSSCMNLYLLSVIKQNNLRFGSERVAVAEDYLFNLDFFCCAQTVSVMNEVGYFYFENTSSISRKYDPQRFDRTIRFYDVLRERISRYGLEDKVAHRAERTFLLKIRVTLRLLVCADLPRKEKFKEIHRILNHELVKEILNRYPVETFIPSIRILVKWMRARNIKGVYWLVRSRESARRSSVLKSVLKRIGIGK